MSEIKLYVTYFIAQQTKLGARITSGASNVRPLFPTKEEDKISDVQRQAVNGFIESEPNSEIISTHIETMQNKRSNSWPELTKAIANCKERGATLIISELGTLTNNESFSKILLDSKVNFYCCDQPFVNSTILEALFEHAKVQKKLHGELIRKGLKMTSAKSGNPNAAKVISKVNKPKIDTAIVFACLLQPIISDYRRKGYSQRQMVKTLNEEGFTAPEGGKWVLSQLQKVLDRVRLNEVAFDAREVMQELRAQDLTNIQIAEELNRRNVNSIKRSAWDETQVNKLITRLDQINEIELINTFVLNLIPILHSFRANEKSSIEIMEEFEKTGIKINQANTEVTTA